MGLNPSHPAIAQARERGLIREHGVRPGASAPGSVTTTVFVKTPNYSNTRVHHMARHRQVQAQYGAVWGALFDVPKETRERLAEGCTITLTRIAAGKADKDDGLRACLKSIKDVVAVWLFDGTYGQRDDDDRAEWRFAWEKAKRGVHAVRISVEPRTA